MHKKLPPKPKRQVRATPGTVVLVKIDEVRFVLAVLVQEGSFAFFAPAFTNPEQPPAIDLSRRLFTIPILDYAVTSGRWRKIAKCDPALFAKIPRPRFYVHDQIDKRQWRIYDHGKMVRATREECVGLEVMAVWSPEHVEGRIRENLEGRTGPWEKGTPLTASFASSLESDAYVVDKWGYLNFRSDDIPGSIEAFVRLGAKWASFNAFHGFAQDASLAFLESHPEVTGIAIANSEQRDVSVLTKLPWLGRLSFRFSPVACDLSALAKLEELRIGWDKRLVMPPATAPIQRLHLGTYSPASKDLSALPHYKHLLSLHLVRGNLASLDGIERFTDLREIDLAYTTRLASLAALSRSSVTHAHFESFKSVTDWESLGKCKTMESIGMSRMGTIPSLGFIREMPKLREFRFVVTEIEDGDLSPLLGLESVAFFDERHYSHTEEQVLVLIKERKVKASR